MKLRVNPIACEGHGACAELLPELVALDEWGFPIVPDGEIPRALERHAKRAVAACPTRALIAQHESSRASAKQSR